MAAARDAILAFLDDELEVHRYHDYGPIGLQVVGAEQVERVALSVSSTLAVFEQAAAYGAQLLIAHHGLFWNNDSRVVDPTLRARLKALFDADMSLAAYHLPLDGHPVHGNNAELARLLGLAVEGWFGEGGGVLLAAHGTLVEPCSAEQLTARVETVTGRPALLLPGSGRPIVRLGVCSGAAAFAHREAAQLGLDALVTGEAEEPSAALAAELGVALIAGGHYATETFGVHAVGRLLHERFGLSTHFCNVENPV